MKCEDIVYSVGPDLTLRLHKLYLSVELRVGQFGQVRVAPLLCPAVRRHITISQPNPSEVVIAGTDELKLHPYRGMMLVFIPPVVHFLEVIHCSNLALPPTNSPLNLDDASSITYV